MADHSGPSSHPLAEDNYALVPTGLNQWDVTTNGTNVTIGRVEKRGDNYTACIAENVSYGPYASPTLALIAIVKDHTN